MSFKKVLLGSIASVFVFSACIAPSHAETMKKMPQQEPAAMETPCERERNEMRPYIAARTGLSMEKNHIDKNVWFGAGAVGIQIKDFRTEIEYSYRDKMKGIYMGDEHKVTTQSLMLNAYYDIPTGMALRPFISAGVGGSEISVKTPFEKDSTHKFTWSAGVGAAYEITTNFALDIGYRFIDIGADVKTNEFYGGLRYAF